jgi:hypothetical protein
MLVYVFAVHQHSHDSVSCCRHSEHKVAGGAISANLIREIASDGRMPRFFQIFKSVINILMV